MAPSPLAHSAPKQGRDPQAYADHILRVIDGAVAHARAAAWFVADQAVAALFVKDVEDAARFHDLGKLDPDNQAVLKRGRRANMPWDHIDAGVAHLMTHGAGTAAWAVRAHHAPGLPEKTEHFSERGRNADQVRKLRGRRNDDESLERHQDQIVRTDSHIREMLLQHNAEVGSAVPNPGKSRHGLTLRFVLSCLVDADHANSAYFDTGYCRPVPPAPRWLERLAALDRHVADLQVNGGARAADRAAFYDACRNRIPDAAMAACEGPVGIGKTTAVTAYLLQRAVKTGARRLIIVAPYTTILSQTAKSLRAALLLDGEEESAQSVVAEHHHRADFDSIDDRDLATSWSAPILLTTAVQFFETLSANAPAALRKLHALPGSVVFIDESHAAIPAHLWPQTWRWLNELVHAWSCSFVFASGSLARFWENEDIIGHRGIVLPDLVPADLANRLIAAESIRVKYASLGRLAGPEGILQALMDHSGPRLLIMNTVQSAAVMARYMKTHEHDVLHLSTALCPTDRENILKVIRGRLETNSHKNWTLVATSLVEAGVDLSFRAAFRERFSTASLIQVGGRTNRHGDPNYQGLVMDFFFDGGGILTKHPAAEAPAQVLHDMIKESQFEGKVNAAELVTIALRREIKNPASFGKKLCEAESANNYPEVAKLGRIIDADTRLVVVDPILKERIANFERVQTADLLAGSVQIWSDAMRNFGLETIHGRSDIYWWPHKYEADFLGYMAGALPLLTGEALFV